MGKVLAMQYRGNRVQIPSTYTCSPVTPAQQADKWIHKTRCQRVNLMLSKRLSLKNNVETNEGKCLTVTSHLHEHPCRAHPHTCAHTWMPHRAYPHICAPTWMPHKGTISKNSYPEVAMVNFVFITNFRLKFHTFFSQRSSQKVI